MQESNVEPVPPSSEEHTGKTKAPKKRKKTGKEKAYVWPIKATILSLCLAGIFSFGTELTLSGAGIAVSAVIIVVLIFVSILFDMMGLAVASCDTVPLASMASRKVKGARHALTLCKKANVVSSVCNDIVGDCIGIIAGVCGATLSISIAGSLEGMARLAVSVAVSAVIAALTIGGKASMKNVAINSSTKIVLTMGRVLAVFKKEGRK